MLIAMLPILAVLVGMVWVIFRGLRELWKEFNPDDPPGDFAVIAKGENYFLVIGPPHNPIVQQIPENVAYRIALDLAEELKGDIKLRARHDEYVDAILKWIKAPQNPAGED